MVIGNNIRVPEEHVEARRAVRGPLRGCTRKGAVLIRDMRLWHRGTPNRSAEPRFMVAMIHTVCVVSAGLPRRAGSRSARRCSPAARSRT